MKEREEKILAYSPNWVGDAVMCLPALKALRRFYPESRILVLAVPWVKEIYELSGIPDHVLCYDRTHSHSGLRGTMEIARDIRKLGTSAAFIFPNSWRSALVPLIAGIPVRVGFSTRHRKYPLLTHFCRPEKNFKSRHQVFYYLNVVEILHPDLEKYQEKFLETPFLDIGKDYEEKCLRVARRFGLDPGRPWFAIAPGAQYGEAKLWWPENFAQVAEMVAAECESEIVILGSSSDTKIAKKVISGMKLSAFDLTGRTSLTEAMILLQRCRVFLTNDSGLMHIGAAFGVPLVAIFGSTDPVHTGPYGKKERTIVLRSTVECSPCFKRVCPLGNKRCMSEINTKDVFESVMSLWKNL